MLAFRGPFPKYKRSTVIGEPKIGNLNDNRDHLDVAFKWHSTVANRSMITQWMGIVRFAVARLVLESSPSILEDALTL
jgi:hypothetical protein